MHKVGCLYERLDLSRTSVKTVNNLECRHASALHGSGRETRRWVPVRHVCLLQAYFCLTRCVCVGGTLAETKCVICRQISHDVPRQRQ
jgi:hypothetical protein